MRILSLNAWGGQLHEELLTYLPEADAEVYCLQEIARSYGVRSPWLTYRDGPVELQQRADLYGEIASALPGHDGFYAPTARGELFDGDRTVWQEFGLATFVRSSLAVIGGGLDFVHGSFSPDGFGDHPRSRNVHAVRVFDYDAGHAVTVVQLHGIREESGKGDTPARDAQTAALLRFLDRVRPAGDPLVVCGDFNVLPDSRLLAALREYGLTELVTGRGFTDTRTSYYRKPGRYADYLLVSPEVDVADFTVVETPEVSDHRPLLVTIR